MDALINVNGEQVQALQILFITTLLTLLPSMVIMMTSFTRYVISFSFLRSAMGLQQNPPNMVLVGMALFLTLFTMSPVVDEINEQAYKPYSAGEITQEEFLQRAEKPLKEFMARQTETSSLELFCDLAQVEAPEEESQIDELPLRLLVPAFVTSVMNCWLDLSSSPPISSTSVIFPSGVKAVLDSVSSSDDIPLCIRSRNSFRASSLNILLSFAESVTFRYFPYAYPVLPLKLTSCRSGSSSRCRHKCPHGMLRWCCRFSGRRSDLRALLHSSE